ncbi:MAG: trehalose-phosphatase [Halanaerobiaceae bacterium]
MIHYLLSADNLNKFKNRIKNKNIILFLDYDGTLALFKDNPAEAVPFPGIKNILKKLIDKKDIYISIISGRDLNSLNSLINLEGINYAGTHGLEIKMQDRFREENNINNTEINGKIDYKILENIKNYFDRLIPENDYLKYEDKGIAVAFHYPDSYKIDKIIQELRNKIDNKNMEIIKGRNVIEVRPSGWNKGHAVNFIKKYIIENTRNKNNNDYISVYIGDDTTDEDAFKALDGINIYVKNEDELTTHADYYLNNPKEVFMILKVIAKNYT